MPLPSCSQTGGFHQYGSGDIVVKRQATAVDHANEGAASADLGDEGSLTESHFSNSLAKSRFAI
jgi:hypothetical protein